ncbi:MAG: hypothetical protein WD341_16055 [Tistlia sp.]|uniref:hypothetical protein n=1 Tax=Tistlia sp. TaxID=3057121 RepID=UPI0034A528B0
MRFDPGNLTRHRNRGDHDPDIDRLLVLGGTVAGAFFLASLAPPPLAWAIFGGLLQWAALGSLLAAALLREPVWAPQVTLWDQAAALLLLALAIDLALDPQAVADQLAALQQAGVAAP